MPRIASVTLKQLTVADPFQTKERVVARLGSLPVATYAVELLYALNTGTGFNNRVYTITIQSDGKILVGGDLTSYNGTSQNYITRLNADGTRDTGFTIGTGFNNGVFSIAVQSDGKILVGGFFTTYNGVTQNYITRLNSDGSKDTDLSGTGQGFSFTVQTIVLQSNVNIFVGGTFSSYVGSSNAGIARLGQTSGATYAGFSTGNGFQDSRNVEAIAIQPDGKILAGGNFTIFNGTLGPNRLIRLNADGTRDTGFSIGTGFNSTIFAIALQPDGKILVGGNFTTFNGVTQDRITRLNADGTQDTGFTIGTGFNNIVRAIALQSDGKILVSGDFITYDGVTQNRITLLNTDGSRGVDEGSQLTVSVTTANVRDGTVLRWRILDQPNDFTVNTDTVVVSSNTASFTVTPIADLETEGAETFRVQLEKITGTIVDTTSAATINDTSTNPGTIAFKQAQEGVAVYQMTSTIDTKYSGTPTIGGGNAASVAFSPVGNKLAIGSTGSPYIQVFSTDPDTLTIGTKYSDPAVAPADGTGITPSATAIAFHPNNNAIAMVRFGGIDVWAWDPVTGFGTKYAYPSQSLFTGSNNTVTGVQWSPSGNDIAISHLGAPFISVYPWSAASGFGTKYTDPAHPAFKVSTAYNVAWHPSGNAIAFSHLGGTDVDSEFVQVWSWTSGTGFGTRYTPPAGVPGNLHGPTGYSVAWSPAGTEIVLGTNGSGDGSTVPRIHAWPWTNASGFGTKYANPATPLGNTNPGGIHFTKGPGDPTLIIGLQNISPWVATYAWSASGFGAKLADPATPLTFTLGSLSGTIAVI